MLVLFLGISCFLGSLSGVAWLEWMSDVIPPGIRGAYLGKRNMVCAAAGMVAILVAGGFLNLWERAHGKEDPFGYLIIFSVGLLFGLIASVFLYRVKDPQEGQPRSADATFKWSILALPFRDKNFCSLVIFVASFMFATGVAGPFYAVYMIEDLQINFGTITWFITLATLTSLFFLRIWGPIADTMGNKPILIVAGIAHALIPLVWVVAQPGLYYWALVLAHVLSGAIFCGLALAQVNLLIKLAPERGRSVFFAVFNGSIGLSVAVAPIVGGWLLEVISGTRLSVGNYTLNSLQVLFLISGGLQLASLFALFRVREEGSTAPVAVLMQLRNDLDPQTGLASATDFVMFRATKTTTLFRHFDQRSDDWASRSEAWITARINRLGDRWQRPVHIGKTFWKDQSSWKQ